MSTLIIGANGQIGRLLIGELAAAGETPLAMIRDPEQGAALEALGARPVTGDLEEDITELLKDCRRVVFTAGSGGKTGADKTILVDMWGAIRAVDASLAAGIEQFVMVSARGAQDPERGPLAIKHYSVCKKMADDYLRQSGVPYTILRPGRLTDEPAGNGFTSDWPKAPEQQCIARADVARAVAHCLGNPRTLGKTYPLFRGEQSLEQVLG